MRTNYKTVRPFPGPKVDRLPDGFAKRVISEALEPGGVPRADPLGQPGLPVVRLSRRDCREQRMQLPDETLRQARLVFHATASRLTVPVSADLHNVRYGASPKVSAQSTDSRHARIARSARFDSPDGHLASREFAKSSDSHRALIARSAKLTATMPRHAAHRGAQIMSMRGAFPARVGPGR